MLDIKTFLLKFPNHLRPKSWKLTEPKSHPNIVGNYAQTRLSETFINSYERWMILVRFVMNIKWSTSHGTMKENWILRQFWSPKCVLLTSQLNLCKQVTLIILRLILSLHSSLLLSEYVFMPSVERLHCQLTFDALSSWQNKIKVSRV